MELIQLRIDDYQNPLFNKLKSAFIASQTLPI